MFVYASRVPRFVTTRRWRVGAGVVVLAATGCTTILGDSYEVRPEDSGAKHDGKAVVDSGPDVSRLDAAEDAGNDAAGEAACAPLESLANKAAFENEHCAGLTCNPVSNAALSGNAHCSAHDDALHCTLPTYVAGDSGAAEAGPKDAGAPDVDALESGTPDAVAEAAVDAGPMIPKCSALPDLRGGFKYPTTTLYAIGSTAIQPYVAHLAQIFAAGVASVSGGSKTAITIIYAGAGSCVGVQAAYAPPGSSAPPIRSLATTANYYDPALDPNGDPIAYTCELDTDAPADLGISDVFPSSCTALAFNPPSDPLPAPYYDFFGPVQVMEMLVPVSSSATAISYEETGVVWGYGSSAPVKPWTDDHFLFKRTPSSGTQTMISLAVGLDPRVWVGVPEASSGAVKSALLGVGGDDASKTLGVLASDVADGIRQSARPLAFQDKGETCAWLPDSSLATFDKKNVRDGHYPIWGPSHFITTVDSSFLPKSTVAKLIAALSGTDADVAKVLDVIQLYATNHVVPTCAMHVSRTSDGASYTYYQPPGKSACSCYYDDQVPLDTTSCTACTTDSDCVHAPGGATSCNIFGLPPKGFCETPGQ